MASDADGSTQRRTESPSESSRDSSGRPLAIHRVGHVLQLTFNRPDVRNAISAELASDLCQALLAAEEDPELRAVVVTAEGPVFAAGGDLAEIQTAMADPDGADRVIETGEQLRMIERSRLPVIAALTGSAYGGGAELLLLFDYVVAESHAFIEYRHVKMGLSPAWGAAARLLERVGPQAASRMLLWGERISAAQALASGLVGEVCAEGEALGRALSLAQQVAKQDPNVLAANKRGLQQTRLALGEAARSIEMEVFRSLWGGEAQRSAVNAFFAGRANRSEG